MFFCSFLRFVFMLETPWQSSRILICDRWKKFLDGNFDGKLKMVKKPWREFWWKTQNSGKNLEGKRDGNLTKGKKNKKGKRWSFSRWKKKMVIFFRWWEFSESDPLWKHATRLKSYIIKSVSFFSKKHQINFEKKGSFKFRSTRYCKSSLFFWEILRVLALGAFHLNKPGTHCYIRYNGSLVQTTGLPYETTLKWDELVSFTYIPGVDTLVTKNKLHQNNIRGYHREFLPFRTFLAKSKGVILEGFLSQFYKSQKKGVFFDDFLFWYDRCTICTNVLTW